MFFSVLICHSKKQDESRNGKFVDVDTDIIPILMQTLTLILVVMRIGRRAAIIMVLAVILELCSCNMPCVSCSSLPSSHSPYHCSSYDGPQARSCCRWAAEVIVVAQD